MGDKKITREEAYDLICPVLDDEASDEEVQAFTNHLDKDDGLLSLFTSFREIKNLISKRCPRAKAPDSLYHFTRHIQEKKPHHYTEEDTHFLSSPGNGPSDHTSSKPDSSNKSISRNIYYAAAASLLFIIGIWAFFSFSGKFSTQQPNYIDNQVVRHFEQNKGQLLDPHILTSDVGSAEVELRNRYKIELKVPVLRGANFKGVVYQEFIDGFKTPMLEYSLPEKKDTIYVFAFRMSDLSKESRLLLFPKAVKSVISSQDYYVREIDGKQMVNWKWDNVWYTAISNEDGNSLAARIEELKKNVTRL